MKTKSIFDINEKYFRKVKLIFEIWSKIPTKQSTKREKSKGSIQEE